MSKKSEPERPNLWEQWTASFSPAARSYLAEVAKPAPTAPSLAPRSAPEHDDSAEAYVAFREALTPAARDFLDSLASTAPTVEERAATVEARYGLVECRDGEWANLLTFKTPEGLARRIGDLVDQDVVVWAFYGIPIPLTCGPQRYLVLPDGDSALQVPLYPGGPCRRVDASLLSGTAVQDDGFLGPVELSEPIRLEETLAQPVAAAAKKASKDDAAKDDGDEDTNDEDDD